MPAVTHEQKNENQGLRIALDLPDGFDRFKHHEAIEDAQRAHPHAVVYRELVHESNCATYAFGLFQSKTYRAVAGNFERRIFAGQQFMEWLLRNHLQEIDRPVRGCLAMYFANGIWQHVGVVSGVGRITSQWGLFPVYEHGVFEVPARYGDEVRYFRMLRRGEALRLFVEFAKTHGLSDADIARVVRDA